MYREAPVIYVGEEDRHSVFKTLTAWSGDLNWSVQWGAVETGTGSVDLGFISFADIEAMKNQWLDREKRKQRKSRKKKVSGICTMIVKIGHKEAR